jgi:hypothetical protein
MSFVTIFVVMNKEGGKDACVNIARSTSADVAQRELAEGWARGEIYAAKISTSIANELYDLVWPRNQVLSGKQPDFVKAASLLKTYAHSLTKCGDTP